MKALRQGIVVGFVSVAACFAMAGQAKAQQPIPLPHPANIVGSLPHPIPHTARSVPVLKMRVSGNRLSVARPQAPHRGTNVAGPVIPLPPPRTANVTVKASCKPRVQAPSAKRVQPVRMMRRMSARMG